jgi:hypothetical protein
MSGPSFDIDKAVDYSIEATLQFFSSLTEVPFKDWNKQVETVDQLSYAISQTANATSKVLFAATVIYAVSSLAGVAFWATAFTVGCVGLHAFSKENTLINSISSGAVDVARGLKDFASDAYDYVCDALDEAFNDDYRYDGGYSKW